MQHEWDERKSWEHKSTFTQETLKSETGIGTDGTLTKMIITQLDKDTDADIVSKSLTH